MLTLIILFLWPRCSYLMLHPAPPPVSAAAHFNPLITSAAPPLPHTRSGKSSPCECGQTGHHLAVIPVRSLYKQPHFTVSPVVPVEIWKSTPPSLQSWLLTLSFSLLYYSIEISLFRFSILLLFLTMVDFLAMQLSRRSPLGVQGACSLIPSDVPLVIWHMGSAFLRKTLVNMIFFVSNPNVSFCAGFN